MYFLSVNHKDYKYRRKFPTIFQSISVWESTSAYIPPVWYKDLSSKTWIIWSFCNKVEADCGLIKAVQISSRYFNSNKWLYKDFCMNSAWLDMQFLLTQVYLTITVDWFRFWKRQLITYQYIALNSTIMKNHQQKSFLQATFVVSLIKFILLKKKTEKPNFAVEVI